MHQSEIGQMLVVGFPGLMPPDYILEWLASGRIGGVLLFSRNIESPAQVAALTRACHEAASEPILIGIDQEGGVVARLREGFTESPGAMALSAADDPDLAREMARVLALEMRALGINWNYAPVADLTHNINNASVGTRSLGTDLARVTRFATAQITGFQEGGVAACVKHFPGLGNTPVDTHEALAVIDDSLDDLRNSDLTPFKAAIRAGVASVMTTHVKFPALDANHPATLSPVVIQKLLREEMGFDGVIASDCMEMHAITDHYGPGESAVLAALAGVDVIHLSHTRAYQAQAYEVLVEALESGRLPGTRVKNAVKRIRHMKAHYRVDPTAIDPASVAHPDHRRTAHQAARRSVALHGDLTLEGRIALVEFASYMDSEVMEQGGKTGFVTVFHQALPEVAAVSLRAVDTGADNLARARQLAHEADTLVLVTRNAHLILNEQVIAQELMNIARRVVLVCLKNPYDVGVLPGAAATLLTFGDSLPSMQAAVAALMGEFVPSGIIPVGGVHV